MISSPTPSRIDPEPRPYRSESDGLTLTVRLTPRAGRAGLDGIRREADGRTSLGLRVAAPPVEGAANAALIAFVAGSLGLRKADVTLASGAASRVKRLHLAGDAENLAARMEAWLAGAEGRIKPP